MAETTLPFDCIATDYLVLTERKQKKKAQNTVEYLVHPNTVSIPYSNTYQHSPLEFSLNDAVMVSPPCRIGVKMIASFAINLDTPSYNFVCALDARLRDLVASTKGLEKDVELRWAPLINEHDGEMKLLLPFNVNKQPHLPSFDGKERCSVHHIKQGTPLKMYVAVHHAFLICPENDKNKSGKYQAGAMLTINRLDIENPQ